jgi:hypothetical protein
MPNILSVGHIVDKPQSHIMQSPLTIQSPNGEMHICRIIDEEYGEFNCDNQEIIREGESVIFLHCGVTYYLTPNEIAQKHLLYMHTKIVRVICSFDIIFYIFLTLSSNYFLYGIFMLIVSLFGLDATISYSKCSTLIYLGFQYIQTISKFYIICGLFVDFTIQNGPSFYINNNNGIIIKETQSIIVIFIIISFCQIFVTYNVHRLYQLLPSRRAIQ